MKRWPLYCADGWAWSAFFGHRGVPFFTITWCSCVKMSRSLQTKLSMSGLVYVFECVLCVKSVKWASVESLAHLFGLVLHLWRCWTNFDEVWYYILCWNIFSKYSFGSCEKSLTPTLHEAKTKLSFLSKMTLTQKTGTA